MTTYDLAARAVHLSPHLDEYGYVLLAFVLSAAIGLEREMRHRSAGLRTHALVGFGAAIIMVVSKYGFADVIAPGHVVLDPSRIAAQIVSGIGFIGGGLIFVRRDTVRGLTTAATIWLVAGVGMACGASLPFLAIFATAGHFVIVLGLPPVARAMHRLQGSPTSVHINYTSGRGVLGQVLMTTTGHGFTVNDVSTDRGTPAESSTEVARDRFRDREATGGVTAGPHASAEAGVAIDHRAVTALRLHLSGRGSMTDLVVDLSELPGVVSVSTDDPDSSDE